MAITHHRFRPAQAADEYFHFGFGSRRYEAVRKQKSFHRHDEIELLFIERGEIDHLVGGRRVKLSPGRLHVFWGAIPHAPLSVQRGTIVNRLTLPLPWFLQWQLPASLIRALLAGETIIDADPRNGTADLHQFARWHEDLQEGSSDRRKLVLLECEARLRRLYLAVAGTLEPNATTCHAPRDTTKVEQMSRFVAVHYAEQLRLADIADSVGLNPNYAAELFRKTCGRSLLEFLNGHRISHAQRLLATTDAKIIDVALMTGFGSPSRFYSAFKKACAQTPRDYRRTMGLPGANVAAPI